MSPRLTDEARSLWRLAGPLALANIGNQLLGAVDTAVVGRLSEDAFAAVGLGNMVTFTVLVLGLGIMLGFEPLVAQAVGAGERTEARTVLWQALSVAAVLSVPLIVMLAAVVELLPAAGIARSTADLTAAYVLARLPGLPLFLVFVGGRGYLQGHDITAPMVVGVVLANVVNLPLSWLLVFGDGGLTPLGLPAIGAPVLGVAGAAWASTASIALQCAVVLLAVSRLPVPDHPKRRPDAPTIRRALRLGVPVAFTILAEVGIFALVTLMVGWLGTRPLAAHNVALTLASTTFQVTLALSAATSVRVGRAVGAGDVAGTRRAGLVGLGSAAAFMGLTGLTFLAVPAHLGTLLTSDPGVVEAAVPLLLVAAAFQLADGLQVVGAGALRGAGDTRLPLLANLAGHYAIGLPLGAWLAFGFGWGARGLWWGLSAGLSSVAVLLTARFIHLSRRPVARA